MSSWPGPTMEVPAPERIDMWMKGAAYMGCGSSTCTQCNAPILTTDGCVVESNQDVCQHGHASWPVYLRLIPGPQ